MIFFVGLSKIIDIYLFIDIIFLLYIKIKINFLVRNIMIAFLYKIKSYFR